MTSHGITQADKVIIVMGPTGAGKSTVGFVITAVVPPFSHTNQFIDYAMGGSGQGIGHNMKSCTQDIVVRRTSMGASSQFFAFVDTPGLDDTHKQDYDILEEIAKFLIKAHKDGLQLDKVLYLHRISDNRLTVSPEKSFDLFSSLCDEVEIPPVTIVTTMWSLVTPEIGQLRSTDLRETLQSKTKDGGWQIVEFDGTTESARAIAQAQRESPNAASRTKEHAEHADNGETPGATEANIVPRKQLELSPKKKEARFKLFPLQGNPAAKRPPSSDTAKYGIARDDKIIM
ncbi:hypothetical protein FRC18_002418 [Serendipita sp. 400]|nr:hypothetical protein FRC18_002418 [Serendipita sp. 400]